VVDWESVNLSSNNKTLKCARDNHAGFANANQLTTKKSAIKSSVQKERPQPNDGK
jgi:hypothetical protein